MLDSGALYRLTAIAAENAALDIDGESDRLGEIAANLRVEFTSNEDGEEQILLNDEDITLQVRAESTGELASRCAVIPVLATNVRECRSWTLLQRRHHGFCDGN